MPRHELELSIISTGGTEALVSPSVKVLMWPETAPALLLALYLEYRSPPNQIDKATNVAKLLVNQPNVHTVGLVGSCARGEENTLSDIDMIAFVDNIHARQFAAQSNRIGDRFDIFDLTTIYDVIDIDKQEIETILQEGIPEETGITLSPMRLRIFPFPITKDQNFENMFSQANPGNKESFLASFGKDLLFFDPSTEKFFRPEDNWLIDIYEETIVSQTR